MGTHLSSSTNVAGIIHLSLLEQRCCQTNISFWKLPRPVVVVACFILHFYIGIVMMFVQDLRELCDTDRGGDWVENETSFFPVKAIGVSLNFAANNSIGTNGSVSTARWIFLRTSMRSILELLRQPFRMLFDPALSPGNISSRCFKSFQNVQHMNDLHIPGNLFHVTDNHYLSNVHEAVVPPH